MAMKSIYTVSIFIIFALSLSVVPCFAGDFFYLVLPWPGSYCGAKHGCCFPKTGKPAKDFAIAGLRPCYLNATIPQFCDSQQFQYPKVDLGWSKRAAQHGALQFLHNTTPANHTIVTWCDNLASCPYPLHLIMVGVINSVIQTSNLTKSLQRNWPSLACPSSDSKKLWSHEWKKYGTCSGLNQHAYFEAALRLKSQVNLLKILNNAGDRLNHIPNSLTIRDVIKTVYRNIRVSCCSPVMRRDGIQANGRFYNAGTGIEEAIQMGVGYMPGLWCNEDKTGNSQLYQVVVCGDVKGTRIIDCPGIPMGKCGQSIKFPPF
ncbi:hypothetical protein Acr_02g0012300 [Actinidia rufa]|uniref:Uncharacterized protein n=1 Tax=Actinidia rufa TaxID=165716 RepID=A0A7J0E9B2_9ERIC|nr:hypothetical protein Acr_02g0012300 [Actinidia rufa]